MAIQIRRGSKSSWESNKSNVVAGEPVVATDTGEVFVGTGTGTYTALFKWAKTQDIGVTDANNLTINGMYSGYNLTNAPMASTWCNYVVYKNDDNADFLVQLAYLQTGDYFFIRRCYSGTWDSWKRYYSNVGAIVKKHKNISLSIAANNAQTVTVDISSDVPSGYKLVLASVELTGGNTIYNYSCAPTSATTIYTQWKNTANTAVTATARIALLFARDGIITSVDY